MGFSQKILPNYTYNDYLHWEGRWELIDGHPIAMSPSPVPKHQRIAGNLTTEINIVLKKCKHCNTYISLDYKISDYTIVQPDILVACGELPKPYLDFPPQLVVEILSSSTALRDRNTKFEIYQQQKIKYYLIVDADNESIEIYELINDRYQLQQSDKNHFFEFVLDADCRITPDLNAVW